MRHLGLPFQAAASNYREVHHRHLTPRKLVEFLAEGKARAAAKKHPTAVVIGGDTIVAMDNKVFWQT